jgi:mannose-6-phosphate isomerase-like protein (cupin superfamily)
LPSTRVDRDTRDVFETKTLPTEPTVVAPDGSDVRVLLGLAAGGMGHFELAAGETSIAVRHRTVEEIWFIVAGRGEMWRRRGADETTVELVAGICLTIPLGTEFQFRSDGPGPLTVVASTMPPWPGAGEAVRATGPWTPTLAAGPGLDEH